MSKHRILILTNRVPFPMNDGGNLAVKAMIDGYKDAGMEVHLLSMNTSRHSVATDQLSTLFLDIKGFESHAVNNDVRKRDIIVNYLFSRKPNHVVRFKDKEFAIKLQQTLEKIKPDIVQVESIFLTSYLPLIKKTSPGAVTVLRLHNIEHQIWQRFGLETISAHKKFYVDSLARRMRIYEHKAWTEYDLLLAITDVDAAMVRKSGVQTPMVIAPFGIDHRGKQASLQTDVWNGYHLGSMDWMPNGEAIDWFLREVWPDMHKLLPVFEFHFAGRRTPESYKQLNIPGVYCLGEVPDANAFVEDKKILIVPLRAGSGIRIKILEAMALKKLVISTDIGIQGIAAEPGKHYLAANTKEDFINAVKWCVDNKAEAATIGENAAQLIKDKFDRRVIMKRIIDQINQMHKTPTVRLVASST